jgi:hypothetical protein
MQGDEVTTKRKADFQFIWCDSDPTLFSSQKFDMSSFNHNHDNIFKYLEKQINPNKISEIIRNQVYLMNPYHVHSAKESKESPNRLFIRASFSYVPVTSIKMTINPHIQYNYPIHQSSGIPPRHLK